MTIGTILKLQWLLEIGLCMTLHAGYLTMFAKQRKFGSGMIEGEIHLCG